jgi:hypothetical protein
MANAGEVRFSLSISSVQFLSFYRGRAREIQVRRVEGRVVRFPANILRPFMTDAGVRGEFVLEFDECSKFIRIRKSQRWPHPR